MSHCKLKNQLCLTILLAFEFNGFATAQGLPGGMNLTEDQKNCMENTVGIPSGGPPPMDKVKAAFEKCGVTPPGEIFNDKSSMPAANHQGLATDDGMRSKPEANIHQYIFDLRSLRGANDDYIRLDGKIPKKCVGKVSLAFSCDELDNVITFTFSEISSGALKCLQDNRESCRASDSTECVRLENVARNSPQVAMSNRIDSQVAGKTCKTIDLRTAKVSIESKKYAPTQTSDSKESERTATEAGICESCRMVQNFQIDKLTASSRELVRNIQPHGPAVQIAQQMPPVDTEAMKIHMERQKERMLKKIKSMPCKMPGEDNEEFDPSSMRDMMNEGEMAGFIKAPPGTAKSGELEKMFAGNLDFMDDIQDAQEAKMEKCQREAKRRMSSGNIMAGVRPVGQMSGAGGASEMLTFMGAGGLGGTSGIGGMNGMSSLMGLGGLGGMSSIGSMNGMSSMMGLSGLGGMSGVGYGGIGGMSPFSSYGGLNSGYFGGTIGLNAFSPYRSNYSLFSNSSSIYSPYNYQTGFRYNRFGTSSR